MYKFILFIGFSALFSFQGPNDTLIIDSDTNSCKYFLEFSGREGIRYQLIVLSK